MRTCQLNISLSDENISKLSKVSFRTHIKINIQGLRRQYLNDLKSTTSKSQNCLFSEKPAAYIVDPQFSKQQVELLLSLRPKTYDCKITFKPKYGENIFCELCKMFNCTQNHILFCPKIVTYIQKETLISDEIFQDRNVEYIYGNVDQQLMIVKK